MHHTFLFTGLNIRRTVPQTDDPIPCGNRRIDRIWMSILRENGTNATKGG